MYDPIIYARLRLACLPENIDDLIGMDDPNDQ